MSATKAFKLSITSRGFQRRTGPRSFSEVPLIAGLWTDLVGNLKPYRDYDTHDVVYNNTIKEHWLVFDQNNGVIMSWRKSLEG